MVMSGTESEIPQFFELATQEYKYIKFTYNIHINETVPGHKGTPFIKSTETFL
jgi:hypothetical protein